MCLDTHESQCAGAPVHVNGVPFKLERQREDRHRRRRRRSRTRSTALWTTVDEEKDSCARCGMESRIVSGVGRLGK